MIRVLGIASIIAAVALISFKVCWVCALYHATPDDLVEAARLRLGYYLRFVP